MIDLETWNSLKQNEAYGLYIDLIAKINRLENRISDLEIKTKNY